MFYSQILQWQSLKLLASERTITLKVYEHRKIKIHHTIHITKIQ